MKINRTNEIGKVIDRIASNVLDTADDSYTLGMKYQDKIVNEDIQAEIEHEYEKLGLDIELMHTTESLYNIPFNRDIDLTNNIDNKHLRYYTLKKNQLIMMDYSKHDKYLKEYLILGYYPDEVKLPQIVENGNLWMCPTMMEYNTMKESINKSHGKVLVFGCGIGFYQYMCLMREEVESITIVELNKGIIDNFKNNILPQYNINKPVNIIQGDAFEYYNDEFMKDYDYVFVDIWFNNNDGLDIYEKLIKKNVSHKEIDYWIEGTMKLEVKRYIFLYIFKWFNNNLNDVLRVYPENNIEKYCKAVHKVFRKIDDTIDSEEKLLYYIHNDQVIKDVLINL